MLALKFNKPINNLINPFFKAIAYYARWKNISLIGIIDYEVAKSEGKKEFYIKYPVKENGNKLSYYLTLTTERKDYDQWVKNTEECLQHKKVAYEIEWAREYSSIGTLSFVPPVKFILK
ncbi:MAG: hypothetical protein JNM96_05100 [Bacteroidia bacterium]|nr:hypothetical protein [Bacteroidia bacterium]